MHSAVLRITAVLAGSILTLSGCSKDLDSRASVTLKASASPSASGSPSPTAHPSRELATADRDDICESRDPRSVTGGAAKEFGQEAVTDAYCEMMEFVLATSARVDLVTHADYPNGHPEYDKRQFEPIGEYMTGRARARWDKWVNDYLHGDIAARDAAWKALFSITVLNAGYPSWDVSPTMPLTHGHEFSPASTRVYRDSDGRTYLVLDFKFKTQLRLYNGDQVGGINLNKDYTFRLLQTGSEDRTWTIADYSADFNASALKPLTT